MSTRGKATGGGWFVNSVRVDHSVTWITNRDRCFEVLFNGDQDRFADFSDTVGASGSEWSNRSTRGAGAAKSPWGLQLGGSESMEASPEK